MRYTHRVDDRDKPGHGGGEAGSPSSVRSHAPTPVMTGLVPVIHAVRWKRRCKAIDERGACGFLSERCSTPTAWVTGTSPVMATVRQQAPAEFAPTRQPPS